MPRKKKIDETEVGFNAPPKPPAVFFSKEVRDKLKSLKMLPAKVKKEDLLPTGMLQLDAALGGGLARHRITEIAGENGSGKTTIAMYAAGNVIANGGRVAFFDVEHAFTTEWAIKMGIPANEIVKANQIDDASLAATHFHYYDASFAESNFEAMRQLLISGQYDLIIYDSVGATAVQTQIESDIHTAAFSPLARFLGSALPILTETLYQTSCAILFINQLTTNLAQKYMDSILPFGGTMIPKGGKSLAFSCSVRIMMYNARDVKVGDVRVHRELSGMVYKSKIFRSPNRFEAHLLHKEHAIDFAYDVYKTAKDLGIFEMRAAWALYHGEQIGNGQLQSTARLASDPELTTMVVNEIYGTIESLRTNYLEKGEPDNGTEFVDEADVDLDDGAEESLGDQPSVPVLFS